ncbi:hypothetical protein CBR_g32485 [Chara braunii]|uniref:Uncharacterized protein n=1 Tax=Chara braunii TaxID=69332 RepID=A0A388LGR6_CHABU|nr:hypothetical protein CBR_g32485 [Chara braunii]|eukprot:GBG81496.1 hypothetical protein CBR_g32485 [Chara braunii]
MATSLSYHDGCLHGDNDGGDDGDDDGNGWEDADRYGHGYMLMALTMEMPTAIAMCARCLQMLCCGWARRRVDVESAQYAAEFGLIETEAGIPPAVEAHFGILPDQISKLAEDGDIEGLRLLGGVKGVAAGLKVDLENGLPEMAEDTWRRIQVYGTNTFPSKELRSFFSYVVESFQDLTLIILSLCAIASLVLHMVSVSVKEGWYDGVGIAFAVIIVVVVSSTVDYQQDRAFQALNKEKQRIPVNVVRRGKRTKVIIFDLLVGDIVYLDIGDQVPADGLLISGHSLLIDELLMKLMLMLFSIPACIRAAEP